MTTTGLEVFDRTVQATNLWLEDVMETTGLALMIVAMLLLHEAAALRDVSYAASRREVTPVEQHVHSFLEMVRAAAVSFVSFLHWPQLLALFGVGDSRPDWRVRWKRKALPWRYTASMLTAEVALEWLPYLEELVRTIRGQRCTGI
jgi:hypothetical protein